MDKLSIYIVEDMAITRASLEDKLEDNGYLIAGSTAKAETAWEEIRENQNIDLVLIDINLAGEKDGIWLAQNIRKELQLPFIFITAYGDVGTLKEVVDTKPNGYLMKPYKLPTLLTTITIAIENYAGLNDEQKKNEKGSVGIGDVIYIKDSHIRVKLKIEDIMYIQSDGNYLNIYLENKRHVIRSKMNEFIAKLPSSRFIRVHQRYSINTQVVDLIGSDHLSVKGVDIPVSSKYKSELENKLNLL